MIDAVVGWLISGAEWVVGLLPGWPPSGWEVSNVSGLSSYYSWAGGWINLCAWVTVVGLFAVTETAVVVVKAVVWLIHLVKP